MKLILSGGLGIAAAVTFAVLSIGGPSQSARAAAVFGSLQHAIENSRLVRIEYRNLGWNDFSQELLAFVRPYAPGEQVQAFVSSICRDGDFTYRENGIELAWDMRGSAHEDIFVTTGRSAWGYLKLPELAPDFYQRNPHAESQRRFIESAAGGVFVDGLAPLVGPDATLVSGNLNVIGLANRDVFRELVAKIEKMAGSLTVQRENETTRLTAGNLREPDQVFRAFTWQGRTDGYVEHLFATAKFEVQMSGDRIQWVRFSELGDRSGWIEVRFDEMVTDFDERGFELEFHRARLGGTVVSAAELQSLLQGPESP